MSSNLLGSFKKFKHALLHSSLSDHRFGCSVFLSCKPLRPPLLNDLWRFNTRNIGKPSLNREVKALCAAYHNIQYNLKPKWWDSFKDCLKRICVRHAISEASRRRGHILALQKETTVLGHRSLLFPDDLRVQAELLDKDRQLLSYINDKVSFLQKCAIDSKRPYPGNTLKILARLVRERKSSTAIQSLSSGGSVFTSRDAMAKHASSFYEDLYSHVSDGMPSHDIWSTPSSVLPPSSYTMLGGPLSLTELHDALCSLPSNSVPGIDGFPKELYVAYWKDVGPLLLRMFNQFMDGLVPGSFLTAATVLLFKKGDKDEIGNYRPISLLGVDYKILAKVLL